MSVEVAGVALEAQAPAAAMAALLPQGLLACVEENNVAGLLVLLESCSSVDERNEIGQTVLMLAAEQGSLEIVQELLKRGANCNLEDDDSWTALISASKEGHLDIVRELIQNNADIEHREMGGWTALMWAAYKGRTDVARLLLDHKANPNVAGQFSMYPVTWAAGRGHNEIVNMLLNAGSKSNCCDKYGTTPLIWAARKGHLESVQLLLQHSADVNQVGANSMTALIAAVRGGFESVVEELLTKEPDVNLTDKDGNSALMIAAKEGKTEIARDLLDAGAYVNTPDRHGDTVLIWAVKGGHPDIVRALVGKLADVDVRGAENKTALYWAVEKGNSTIVCDILECNPDTEIHTKDGDTPLIKATKMRNVDIVQLLLNKNAKVSAADKNGDTSLHIAIRGRSRKLAELLLRNPKDGRLLYRPNKAGETPYNIDCGHHKSILTQIFGARHLSPNEADGDMLGYDLYSSALADILSEPTMQPPICVGLYAQWGSGKSFLLKKLEDEMKTFAGQEIEPLLRFSWLLVMLTLAFASVLGLVLAVTVDPNLGLAVAFSLLALFYIFLVVVYFGGQQEREGWTWAWLASTWLARQLCYVELLLQLVFTNPPELPEQTTRALPVRFLFTDYSRLTSVGGETSIAEMVATLCDACEREFGFLVTRLYRVFRTENTQGKKGVGRWKKSCCLPSVLLMALVLGCVVALVVLLAAVEAHTDVRLRGALIAVSSVVAMALVAKAPMAWQVLVSLLRSQRQRLLAAAASSHNKLKMEGFMKVLKSEVDLMAKMTKTLDSFTQYQTRLVVIVDGLDTCEQDRVLQMLDTVRILFSQAPFISIFASDPHIIIKAINQNLNSVLRDSNINGHDYMRNVVHLPFFLNNRGPPIARRLAVAAGPAAANGDVPGHEATVAWFDDGEQKPSQHSLGELTKIGSKVSLTRRQETLKRRQMARQLTRQMSFDLSKLLVTEDWFSDINPQTMRRLLNVVSLTGRLLRANQVQFNWDRLATWINMTEQWPYRTSWVVLYLEEVEGVGDHLTLKMVYDRFSSKIPQSKDVEPLLEIDGDARSFEVFLTSRTPTLTVCDVRTFMACTVNLDPKIREIIADVHAAQVGATSASVFPSATAAAPAPGVPHSASGVSASGRSSGPSGAGTPAPFAGGGSLVTQPSSCSYFDGGMGPQHPFYNRPYFAPQLYLPSAAARPPTELRLAAAAARPAMSRDHTNLPSSAALLGDATSPTLSSLPVADVCERLATLEGIDHGLLDKYQDTIRKANINGRVLAQCNMDELKDEMSMNFGDWQLFRSMVLEMRELEKQPSHDLRSAGESGGGVGGVGALDGGPPPHRERATVTASASVGAAAKPDAALPNDKYSLNFSFEELCTVGLDEPALGGQTSLWQGAGRLADGLSHRTHSMSSLNSEASVAELSRLAERQQAEYRDAYGAYISQMAQVDCPTSGASSIKSSQVTSPHSPVHFLLGGSVSSVSLHEENRNHNACSQRVAAYGGGGATGGGCGGGAGGGGGGQPFSLSASLSSSSSLPSSKAASSHSADASDSSASAECAAAAAVPALDPITEEEDHAGDPAGGRARPAAAAAAASATAAAAATLGKRVLQAVDIKHRSYQQLASDDDNSGADESDDVPLLRSAAADGAAPALERWGPAAAADPDADRTAAQPSDDANTNANNSGGKAGGPAAKSDGYVAEMIPLGKKDSSDSGARVADGSQGPCGFAGPPAARAVGGLVEFAGAELAPAPAAVDAGPLLLLPMPATATAGGGGAPDAPDVTRMSICSDGKRSPSGSESSLILSSPEAERRALVPPAAQAETGRRRKAEPAAVVGGGVLNRVDSVETINNNNRSSLGTGGGGSGVLPSTATAPRSAATPMTPPKKQTARSKMGSIGGGGGGTGAAGRSAGGPAPSSPNVRVPLRGGGGVAGGGGNAAKANTARARVDNARPNLNRKAPAPTRGKKGGGSSGAGGASGAADSAGASAEKESIL